MTIIGLGLERTHLHRFVYSTDTEWDTPYSGRQYRVGRCQCGEVIRSGYGGISRHSDKAVALMSRIARDLGKEPPFYREEHGRLIPPPYGSGWFIELPAVISDVIDREGESVAESLLRAAYAAHDSSVVTRPYLGY